MIGSSFLPSGLSTVATSKSSFCFAILHFTSFALVVNGHFTVTVTSSLFCSHVYISPLPPPPPPSSFVIPSTTVAPLIPAISSTRESWFARSACRRCASFTHVAEESSSLRLKERRSKRSAPSSTKRPTNASPRTSRGVPQAAHSPPARSFSGKFFATPLSSTYRLTWVWFVDAPPGSRGTLSTSCICAIARNVSSETDAADVPACSRSDDAWRAAASADSAGPVAM
mmetsp:Transcript_3936/g.8884  ORF Transcript_3936/g.8884 Transcript_3936/m.8884 type:complete len:227 (+) Transcript_3936:189-869(+)